MALTSSMLRTAPRTVMVTVIHPERLLLVVLLSMLPWAVHAGVTLKVEGLQGNMKAAVASGTTLSQFADHPVSTAQMRRLLAKAPAQVGTALAPYGYFQPQVQVHSQQSGSNWTVTLTVDPGKPVRVTAIHIDVPGTAGQLRAVRWAIHRFKPKVGDILDQAAYTASRDAITQALVAHGYLDAKMTTHRVAVTLSSHSAVVNLAWKPGSRYRFGHVNFVGSQLHTGFLKRYLPWSSGDWFDQSQLITLQQRLTGADYFRVVNVEPDLQHRHDGRIDVNVQLKPAKRSVYTGGPFIGTDTGLGLQAGLERRYVNEDGDKWNSHLVVAQRLKSLSSQYTMPLPGSMERAWNFGANLRDADTDTSHSKTLELIVNQTFLWHGWLASAGVHGLSGTFTVGQHGNEPTDLPGIEHGSSTLIYPEISLVKKHGDNPHFVRHGWAITLAVRSTLGSLFSSTSFRQFTADFKWIDEFHRRDRLIVRGSGGITQTGNFSDLPPQLRFFAGGSQSNRGYGFQSIGPRNRYGRVVGGSRLLTGGVTLEHYFTRNWGIAAFVDSGNAFDGTDLHSRTGAGLGLRWRSPLGLIRFGVGVPVHDDRHHGVQLNLVIGPDL